MEEKEEEAGGTEARRSVYPGLGTLNLEARSGPGIAGKGEGGGGVLWPCSNVNSGRSDLPPLSSPPTHSGKIPLSK